jgi:hypothetical protein
MRIEISGVARQVLEMQDLEPPLDALEDLPAYLAKPRPSQSKSR